jgi:hypothetical protein
MKKVTFAAGAKQCGLEQAIVRDFAADQAERLS